MTQTAIKLSAWHANGAIQFIELKSNQAVLVGRSSNCGLRLSGHDISDIHCSIGFEDGQMWVQDWLSARGTRLNGEPVTSRTKVGPGCVVEVGPYKIQISKPESVAKSAIHPMQTEREYSADPCGAQPVGADGSDVEYFADVDDVYDREIVELLQAEIEDLRTALAQRDSDRVCGSDIPDRDNPDQCAATSEPSEKMLQRIQELVEEANGADERVMIVEEMLHAAEDANRSEVEERAHLEAWVGDIEKRIGQRELEHTAELDALRQRLGTADEQYACLQRQMLQAATSGDSAHKRYEVTLENLQNSHSQLQDLLDKEKKERRQLQQKYENQAQHTEVALREELAKIAKEHADMSRLKFEYAQKIKDLEEALPKAESEVDPRLQSLREHRQYLREMSEQKKAQQQLSLSGRLKRLWNLVE